MNEKPRRSLLVDEEELRKFIEWLPDIEWYEAYVVMLLIRSKKLKEMYGFKGTDHQLKLEIVPGYLTRWRERLFRKIKQFALLGYYSEELYEYIRHKPGTRIPEEIIDVPRQLVGVMVSVNPGDWVENSIRVIGEFNESLLQASRNPNKADRLVRRIDLRLPSLCMKYAKAKFQQIDVDTKEKEAIEELEHVIGAILGHIPARVITPHGFHYLVAKYRFNNITGALWENLVVRPYSKKNINGIRRFLEKRGIDRSEIWGLVREVEAKEKTLINIWREKWSKKLGIDPKKIIEIKNDFQEPVPGTLYQGDYVVRFEYPRPYTG